MPTDTSAALHRHEWVEISSRVKGGFARSEYESNWTTWEHGDFYRPKRGYVHIAVDVREGVVLVAACGKSHYINRSEHATGDEPDQCAECWEAM